MGWTPGITQLVSAGFPAAAAIEAACYAQNTEALAILLTSKESIFTEGLDSTVKETLRGPLWSLRAAIISKRDDIQHLILSSLKERRQKLYEMALETLSADEARQLNLEESRFVKGNIESIYNRLRAQRSIPPELDCCRMASPYHFKSHKWGTSFMPAQDACQIFENIYQAGFTEVDEMDESGETPMFKHVRREISPAPMSSSFLYPEEVVAWFLKRGASPMTKMEGEWPSILFYLAAIELRMTPRQRSHRYKEALTKEAVKDFHGIGDNCECCCSSFGCLPTHVLLRCELEGENCIHQAGRLSLLTRWIEEYKIGIETQGLLFKETVRLELFERLGMAHTCCRAIDSPDTYAGLKVCHLPQSERELLKIEDTGLNVQLELLMNWYDVWKAAAPATERAVFEKQWWSVMDGILPPLTHEESCPPKWLRSGYERPSDSDEAKASIRDARARKELATLEKSGVGGCRDFEEAVNDYFSRRRLDDVQIWYSEKTRRSGN